MPYLHVAKGPDQGHCWHLTKPRIILGRDKHCDIVLVGADPEKHKTISQKHAVITSDGASYFIADGNGEGKASHNHTFVNQNMISHLSRTPLKDRDVIRICDFTLVFYESLPPEIPEPDSSDIGYALSHDSDSVFTQTAEKLKLLLEIGNRLVNTLDLNALLPEVVDSLLAHFRQADRGFLIEMDPATSGLVPRVLKTRHVEESVATEFSRSIVRQCLKTKQGLLSREPTLQFPDSDSIIGQAIQSVMAAPLMSDDGRAIGVLLLDSRNAKRKFTEEDLTFLVGVANQASIALANAQFHQHALVNEAYKRDLELARQVTRSFLPAQLPALEGYQFFACNESAQAVGGDYYDFIALPNGRLGILVGDVAGKGVPAALVMARFSAETRASLRTEPRLDVAIQQVNDVMQILVATDRFVTLAALTLDPATHTLTVTNAGHPAPLLRCGSTGKVEDVGSEEHTGPPIGVVECYPYVAQQVILQPGDCVILFSDGVSEAMDVNARQFGTGPLKAILRDVSLAPGQLGERIMQAIKHHAAGCDQHDDITLVCLGRLA
jgi:serine phosphatase RsbU (regulator of sigma subunit)